MLVMPIPMIHLIHEIEYHEKLDGRYEGTFKDPIIIKNVLIVYSTTVKKTGEGKEKINKSKLFIDCVNSDPVIELKVGSKVIFDGKELFVKDVKPILGIKLHHYEVELI
jgi:hypothetical protein